MAIREESVRKVDLPRKLTLFDSTCLVLGIIVGAGIFQVAPDVARGAGSWLGVAVIWILGGIFSLCGALGYAELASAYPKVGGDYVYLTRAYGRWAGFLFGWIQLAVVRPGDIVLMAFIFATYANALHDPPSIAGLVLDQRAYAIAVVVVLTAVNVLGVRAGKSIQNVLTVVKVLGVLGVVGVAVAARNVNIVPTQADPLPMSVALILVLFTYGGWNEVAYVAAEIKRPRHNIVRVMVWGLATVAVLYLLINTAFLHALGYHGLAGSEAVASDVTDSVFPGIGRRLISALICICALGAVNGLIFAGARISYAVGCDHAMFRVLGRWNQKTGTPVRSLLLQAFIAIVLIMALGSFVDTILYTAPAVYAFYLATSLAILVLRRKEPHVARPYRVTGYPATTLLFMAVCAFLIYSAVMYKPLPALLSFALILTGLPIYYLSIKLFPAN